MLPHQVLLPDRPQSPSQRTAGASKKEWPLAQGFDRFYGFIGRETNNWYPSLAEDNHYIEQPYLPEDGYHLSKDLADKAMAFIRDSKQTEPDKPWYLWFCPGANHAPHHAPQEYIDKYKGMFDDGYEAYREWVLPRMIERGIVPEDTELTEINPMPPGTFSEGDAVRPWDTLNGDEKRLFSRMAEVFAGFSDYTDAQVGRIIDYLEESGQLDNTLVIYAADNGASGEGSPNGSVNEGKFFNGYPDTIADNLPVIDKLGSPDTYNHYPTGWAVAFSTPYRMFKRYTYQGGICDPLVISRPKGIAARGEVRDQYHHCTDIVPTIREACGVAVPDVVNGVKQSPLSGVSMRYSFDDGDAPTRKRTQYYEMFGNRAIRHDGWKAVTEHGPMSGMSNFDRDKWQLFHTDQDRSEARDLSADHPEMVQELSALWVEEAKANKVLPLNDLLVVGKDLETFLKLEFNVPVPPSGQYIYYPDTSEIPERSAANTHGVSFKVLSEVHTETDTEGVIFAHGSRFGGHALYIKDGAVRYVYNFLGVGDVQVVEAPAPQAGHHIIGVDFRKERTGEHHESYGPAALHIDGTEVASAEIRTMTGHFSLCGEGLCIGYDSGDAVTSDYTGRFEYRGGRIVKVVFDVADERVCRRRKAPAGRNVQRLRDISRERSPARVKLRALRGVHPGALSGEGSLCGRHVGCRSRRTGVALRALIFQRSGAIGSCFGNGSRMRSTPPSRVRPPCTSLWPAPLQVQGKPPYCPAGLVERAATVDNRSPPGPRSTTTTTTRTYYTTRSSQRSSTRAIPSCAASAGDCRRRLPRNGFRSVRR